MYKKNRCYQNVSNNFPTCTFCGRHNHLTRNCWYKTQVSLNKIIRTSDGNFKKVYNGNKITEIKTKKKTLPTRENVKWMDGTTKTITYKEANLPDCPCCCATNSGKIRTEYSPKNKTYYQQPSDEIVIIKEVKKGSDNKTTLKSKETICMKCKILE